MNCHFSAREGRPDTFQNSIGQKLVENSLSHFCDIGKRVLAAEIKLRNHKEPKCQAAKSVASHFSEPKEIRPDFKSKDAASTLLSTEDLSARSSAEIIGQDPKCLFGGTTIHSAAHLVKDRIADTLCKDWKHVKILVIDEVSFLSDSDMETLDKNCRNILYGGVPIIFLATFINCHQ